MPNRSQEHLIREGRAPSNGEGIIVVTAPSVTGVAQVGETLTAVAPEVQGSGSPSLARQWFRGDTAIGGATGATYILVGADEDQFVSVRYVITLDGFDTVTKFSRPVGPVAAA